LRIALPAWIREPLASEALRAKSLVATVLGDSVAPHGGRIWLGTLIELLAPFGISERLVRTSVFRLVEDGWLVGQRAGRRSVYSVTPAGLKRIEHAQRRIYAPAGLAWDGMWTLLILVGEGLDARARTQIRRELSWEGFAALAPGVYGHPSNDPANLGELLANAGAQDRTSAFTARQTLLAQSAAPAQLVRASWPLDALAARYTGFIASFAAFAQRHDGLDEQSAFVARTLLVHAYRRVVLHDPQLPVELLPADWPGHGAYALCQRAYARLRAPSEAYFARCFDAESGGTPPAHPSFAKRFGESVALPGRPRPQSRKT
jgi:phenylacetic acid degradation operon negative regulatory protein